MEFTRTDGRRRNLLRYHINIIITDVIYTKKNYIYLNIIKESNMSQIIIVNEHFIIVSSYLKRSANVYRVIEILMKHEM